MAHPQYAKKTVLCGLHLNDSSISSRRQTEIGSRFKSYRGFTIRSSPTLYGIVSPSVMHHRRARLRVLRWRSP
jgi:hypothetical protein